MRRDNIHNNSIFMMSEDTILQVTETIKANDGNIVFFQAGEVPQTTKLIGRIIPKIGNLFNDDVEILLNLGLKKRDEYAYLRDQGATSYILKHETSDPELDERLRHQSYTERIQGIRNLRETK
ncbi:MAG: hypothetical protein JO202_03630 [Ktedonobacteraceae bacterium]|nr:hypothetical protein [Ktedonobacteraceae bacterium]